MSKKKLDIWTSISLIILVSYVLFLIYPMFNLVVESLVNKETQSFSLEYYQKFFQFPYYSNTLINSFKVTVAVTLLTLLIGTPMAYFFNMYEIKGKSWLQILIIISSMSAPFIGAYSWILLLGRNGVFTNFFKNVLNIQIPDIYGFNGILMVLTLQLFPLIFLYINGAMKNVDNTLLEAAENLGYTGLRRFRTIVFPLILPTILAGSLLVFMRAFADFGTPMLIGEGYRTFPVLIFSEFIGEVSGDKGFAAAISIIAIGITTIFFLIQSYISNRKKFSMSALHPIEPKKISGIRNILLHLYIYLVIGVAMLPQGYVIYTSFLNTKGMLFIEGYSFMSYTQAFDRLGNSIQNTFVIGGLSLIIIVLLAILIAYISVRRPNVLTKFIDTLSMIPYIIPGSVLGISLLAAFLTPPLRLAGGVTIMVIALVIRRLPYTIRSSAAILQQISISIEEAAISLGASNLKTFFKITVPMMSAGVIAGAILSWTTIITELATGIILYTGRTKTLTIAIYTEVIRGNYGIAAALSTILTILTAGSLILFMKFSKNKDLSV